MEKHSVSRLSYLFAHLHLLSSDLFSSDSSHLCFSTVHIVGSFTSKLPSINTKYINKDLIPTCFIVYNCHVATSLIANNTSTLRSTPLACSATRPMVSRDSLRPGQFGGWKPAMSDCWRVMKKLVYYPLVI